jgi:hypothetical protein
MIQIMSLIQSAYQSLDCKRFAMGFVRSWTLDHSKTMRPVCGTCKGFRNRQLIYVYVYDCGLDLLVIELQNFLALAEKCVDQELNNLFFIKSCSLPFLFAAQTLQIKPRRLQFVFLHTRLCK